MSRLAITIRAATPHDAQRIQRVTNAAIRAIVSADYTPQEIASTLAFIGPLDLRLIEDGTYYVAELAGQIVGCGGWSLRAASVNRRGEGTAPEPRRLEPARDAARMRALYVHPHWMRRGIARRLMETAERAARRAGFRRCELLSTLGAEAAFRALEYVPVRRVSQRLPDGVVVTGIDMRKALPDLPVAAADVGMIAMATGTDRLPAATMH